MVSRVEAIIECLLIKKKRFYATLNNNVVKWWIIMLSGKLILWKTYDQKRVIILNFFSFWHCVSIKILSRNWYLKISHETPLSRQQKYNIIFNDFFFFCTWYISISDKQVVRLAGRKIILTPASRSHRPTDAALPCSFASNRFLIEVKKIKIKIV